MKREILEVLKRERDALAQELRRLQIGERKVIHLNSGQHDITAEAAAEVEARLLRFEELIAASEAGLF
jgi:hypothetical protein